MVITTLWINVRNILLKERSQSQKATLCIIPFLSYYISRTGKAMEIERRLGGCPGSWGQRRMGSNYLMGSGCFMEP